jgi:alpha-ribazole phosphatase
MEIYLIRHTRPNVGQGICYGQTDLNVVDSFEEEAAVIKNCLPDDIVQVYSSPLTRCRRLAENLFQQPIQYFDDLMELDCGSWEMQHWDDIPRVQLQPWMENIVHTKVPGGESYHDMFVRVARRYEIIAGAAKPAAIVAHGGVLRSILSHVHQSDLKEAFNLFPLYYGAVARIDTLSGAISMLSNIAVEGEQHRPSDWVK